MTTDDRIETSKVECNWPKCRTARNLPGCFAWCKCRCHRQKRPAGQ